MVDFGRIGDFAGGLLPDGFVKDVVTSGGYSIFSPSSPISDLIASIQKASGVARPNRFMIMMQFPNEGWTPAQGLGIQRGRDKYGININAASRQVVMSCETSLIPPRSLVTTNPKYYGPQHNIAYGHQYPEIDMVFRVSNNMLERKFFEAWQEACVNTHTFDANYLQDYSANIVIKQMGPPEAETGILTALLDGKLPSIGGALSTAQGLFTNKRVKKILGMADAVFNKFFDPNNGDKLLAEYVLEDAFPKIISGLQLDHSSNDQYHKQSVNFVYRKWHTNLGQTSNATRLWPPIDLSNNEITRIAREGIHDLTGGLFGSKQVTL